MSLDLNVRFVPSFDVPPHSTALIAYDAQVGRITVTIVNQQHETISCRVYKQDSLSPEVFREETPQ